MLWSDTSRPSGFSRGLCREEGGSGPKGGEEGAERKKYQRSSESETDAERGKRVLETDRRRETDREGPERAQASVIRGCFPKRPGPFLLLACCRQPECPESCILGGIG